MTESETPTAARPEPRSFDLVHWGVEDSFKRVLVTGPHSLTNELVKAYPHLTYDQGRELAQEAWAGGLPRVADVTAEVSWG
ncbi:hypothetical protein [Deinococcus soli (ex Cha et al. 2016)]|uniref:hypothetical protein n=1 Tax=Deinococcus soli (ex Cha et al. 2016) TaxID=1309411 RepID=UPI00166CFBB8|nr:hypothetical protein [Deinococcus soli (ex Cha et al. 2016)]GGB77892.1 hypothetical protein GCM10008019_37660 [Deinococcus soli (ex Cha et al. 2016)]